MKWYSTIGSIFWYGWCVLLLLAVFYSPNVLQVARTIPPPQAEQFEEQHRLSYDVYAMRNDSSSYDLLAKAFVGPELDRQFLQLADGQHQTRKALANVMVWDVLYQDYKIIESKKEACRVYCKWNVVFIMGHKKHSHIRSNTYEANFDMRWENGRWLIVDSQILSSQKVG